MSKNLRIVDLMPVKPSEVERRLIQGLVAAELRDRVKAKLKKEKRTWEEFLTASALKYLDEK